MTAVALALDSHLYVIGTQVWGYASQFDASQYDTKETYCTVCDEEVRWRFEQGEVAEATVTS